MNKTLFSIICSLGILGCSPSPSTNITVLKINKAVFTGASTDPLASACDAWQLDSESIKKVLVLSGDISSTELHQRFYQLPCEISGRVMLEGKELKFSLNAASFVKLGTNDSTKYKGCSSTKCEPFFLMKPEKY